MTDNREPGQDADAELVAYLDGELGATERAALERRIAGDPALSARLDHLDRGKRPFAESFTLLLADAPADRLAAALAAAEADHARRAARPRSNWFQLAAAAAILVVVGGLVGYAASRAFQPMAPTIIADPQPENWRAVVAEYLNLYTNDTLALIPDDAALRSVELASAGERIDLALTPEKVDLPGLALKRAQLFEFNGMPLAQMAYLSPTDGPVAFCIIANGKPDAPPAFEERKGRNIVFWTKGGKGYMLIGKVPREALEGLAASLDSRVS